jgi:hypothetical protein
MAKENNNDGHMAIFSCYMCVFCTLCVIFIIPAGVITARYSYELDDYIYTDMRNCTVLYKYMKSDTCSRKCNCYRCGKSTCCDTCYYTCYYGCYHVAVGNNIEDPNDIKVNTNLCIGPNDYKTIRDELQTRPNNSTHTCYSDGDDLHRVQWNESKYPSAYKAATIALWSFIGFTMLSCITVTILHIIVAIRDKNRTPRHKPVVINNDDKKPTVVNSL